MPDSTRTFAAERSTLTPEQRLALDRLIDAFEDDLRAGRSPDLAAVVEQGPPATRRVLVGELLHLQLAYRPPPDPAAAEQHYRGRFPEFADQVAAVFRPPASTGAPPPAPSTVPGDAGGSARPAAAPPGGADRYDLGGEIARGGMGVVYAARDRVFDRPVAVKVLSARFDCDSSAARRFLDEARITGQLQHPGVPAAHDLGTLPDGRPFLAMKLIKGQTLDVLLKEQGPGSTRWLGPFEGICQAVGYAHAHGVIHRDLKPQNVMVGAFGEVQVMDWGLAKVLTRRDHQEAGAGDPDDTASADPTEIKSLRDAETRAGSVLGTPAFMAPEQAIGAVDQIDRRTDVFGLGAILCALLTGKPPFVGDTAESTRQLAARAKLDDAFIRLGSCGAEPNLVALCKRCLSAEPADRPANAGELANEVGELRAAADERARRAEVERERAEVESREQRKRRRVVQRAGGAVAAVLALGVTGTTVGLFEARKQEAEAKKQEGIAKGETAEKETARAEESRQRGIAEASARAATAAQEKEAEQRARAEKAYARTADVLDAMVSGAAGDSLTTQKALSPEQRKFLNEVLTYYREFAAGKGEDEQTRARTARTAFRVGLIEYRLGRMEEGATAFELARDEYTKLAGEFPAAPHYRHELARCHIGRGVLLLELGQRGGARAQFQTGLAIQEKLAGEFPATPQYRHELAISHTNLGNLLAGLGQRADAEEQYRKGLALREKLAAAFPVPQYRRDLALSHHSLGALLSGLGHRAEARALFEKGLAIQERLAAEFPTGPEFRADLALSHHSLGTLLLELGQRAEAEEQYRKGLVIRERLVAEFPTGPEFRADLALSHHSLGNLLSGLGRRTEARAQYQTALAIRERLAAAFPAVPQYRHEWAQSQTNLGVLLLELGQRTEARAQYQTALAIQEKLANEFPAVPQYRRDLAISHTNLGILLTGLSQRAEARVQYRTALAIQEKLANEFPAVPQYRVDLGGSYCNLGVLVRDDGQATASLELFDKAIHTLRPIYERESRDATTKQFLRNSHYGRARAYDRLQRFAEAVKDWDRVIELSPNVALPQLRVLRAVSQTHAGAVAEAVAEVAELRKLQGWNAGHLIDFACIYSFASAKVADKKAEYADTAMDLLQKAVKAGWKDAVYLKADTNLSPLRGRGDFQKLLAELEAKREVLPAPRRE